LGLLSKAARIYSGIRSASKVKCEIHETEMEWVETGVEEAGGGYWFCEQCHADEEERLEEAPKDGER
jgi:hypothetical protein